MPHISYSELKDWAFCPFYHKLTRIDKIDGFKGNEYTAFGSAVHTVCEKKLLKEDCNTEKLFLSEFQKNLAEIEDHEVTGEKVIEMAGQAKGILPEIEAALDDYFGDYKVLHVELPLMEPIDGEEGYNFKGFIDAIVETPDGKIHVFDWKTCSWGWNFKKRNDALVTYQLTLYKHFYAQKFAINPDNIETHFALLKRTAKKDRVEFFRVTSGNKKTGNAIELLHRALSNIKEEKYIKNRLSCTSGYGCKFYKTEHCTK